MSLLAADDSDEKERRDAHDSSVLVSLADPAERFADANTETLLLVLVVAGIAVERAFFSLFCLIVCFGQPSHPRCSAQLGAQSSSRAPETAV